ncbi:MAG: hypothetical protein AAB787_01215 [Patescibacteria group bacterium]
MIIIGIDPGKNGAAVAYDGCLKIVVRHCLFRKESFNDFLLKIIAMEKEIKIVIEQVGSRPGQNAKSTFTFGREIGKIEGIIEANLKQEEIVYVWPQTWTSFYSAFFAVVKGKKKSCYAVEKIFPDNEEVRKKKAHDGPAMPY